MRRRYEDEETGPVGDIGYIFKISLEYISGKGQIPSAPLFAALKLIDKYIEERYGVKLHLDEFIQSWAEYSEIEPARYETVAQKNLDILTKIGMQVNMVQEQGSVVRFKPLISRNKKEKK